MKKNIIVIPVYLGHVSRYISLIDNIEAILSQASVLFVTTTEGEAQLFARIAGTLNIDRGIMFVSAEAYLKGEGLQETVYPHLIANTNSCAINLKKMIGLLHASDMGFSFAACIDSDVHFLKDSAPCPMFDALRENYARGLYLGAVVPENQMIDITSASAALFTPADRETIRRMSSDHRFYGWFFDCPAYELADFRHYINYQIATHGSLEKSMKALSYMTFDHICFMWWRCLYGGAMVKAYNDLSGLIPELLPTSDLLLICMREKYFPIWMPVNTYIRDTEIIRKNPQLTLLYHLDRVKV